MPDLEAMADELYAMSEIPEATVPAMMRYSLRFFTYSYGRWIRPSLIELRKRYAKSTVQRPADQVNEMGRELDSMSTNFGERGFSG